MSQYLFYICFIKHSHSVDCLWSMYRPLFFDTWELLSPLQCVHTHSFREHGVITRQVTGWHHALCCYFPHLLSCYLRSATFSLTSKGSWNWPNWLVPRFRGTASNKCCKLYPGLIKKHSLILPFKSVRIQFQATFEEPFGSHWFCVLPPSQVTAQKQQLSQAFFSVFCLNWWQLVILSHKRRQHLSLVRQIGRTGLCCRVKVRMEGKIQRNHVKQTAFLIKILLLYPQ